MSQLEMLSRKYHDLVLKNRSECSHETESQQHLLHKNRAAVLLQAVIYTTSTKEITCEAVAV
jgi:hypothetical protein